ncbi:MAG TPA: DUF362 domain-containing protein [Draconibacterium sp.]|nr:DUF362 domain-containing protein [Draconibacterium sp.]
MFKNNEFDISKLKGKLGRLRDRLQNFRLPSRLLIILLGIASTVWFLIRVIPKPSRASYPCMRVAAPFMSSFVLYLLSVGGIVALSRKLKRKLINTRVVSSILLVFGVVLAMAIVPSETFAPMVARMLTDSGPIDGPNEPMGEAKGAVPGRVVWAWNPDATVENPTGSVFNPENIDFDVVDQMFAQSILKLAGKEDPSEAWDALFSSFNKTKLGAEKGYSKGEKIFIKLNQMTARNSLREDDYEKGFYIGESRRGGLGTLQTGPAVVLAILRQLVNVVGVAQQDIAIGDPQNHVFGENADVWRAEFPDIVLIDQRSTAHGRTMIKPTEELMFYSDKRTTDRLWDVIKDADYMINVPCLKPHLRAGMSLTAKNHFGSHSRSGAYHLHYSLVSPIKEALPTNAGYGKYRVLTDIMGNKYLGRNTMLAVIDGLFGGGVAEGGSPIKYYMPPFNYDWFNSVIVSQDQVAIESVCYDFIRSEFDGTMSHDPSNNRYESVLMPNVRGVDDHLHQAADRANWPEGFIYDPDNSGQPIPSLGIHEHWNNPENKQYSKNLGKSYGIELVSIPEDLVGPDAPQKYARLSTEKIVELADYEITFNVTETTADNSQGYAGSSASNSNYNSGNLISSIDVRSMEDFDAKKFYAVVEDGNGRKTFLTDAGLASGGFRGFNRNAENNKIPEKGLTDMQFELNMDGEAIWLASSNGAYLVSLPIKENSAVVNYNTSNSELLSDTIVAMAVGRNSLRWFGTPKGVSALADEKWLTPDYETDYPEVLFDLFPITSIAFNREGDSVYVGTNGAGVARFYRNDVDAISSASPYANWETIRLPSDNIISMCIASDGTQWFGTDSGIAKHTGSVTLKGWEVLTAEDGLVNNFVQAIEEDLEGNMWFGTKGGLSVYDGSEWLSLTVDDGLISNNITNIMADNTGTVYICTDSGIMMYEMGGRLAVYK